MHPNEMAANHIKQTLTALEGKINRFIIRTIDLENFFQWLTEQADQKMCNIKILFRNLIQLISIL